jgi:serine-type D-Ala-D-Ala carboxypeptidase/endopeptidase (penicillin-binding protein 4)
LLRSLCKRVGESLLVLLIAQGSQAAEAACSMALGRRIETITQRPEFRQMRWGILIQTVSDDPQTLYAQDAEKLFVPASNVKLLTTAAALTQFGPNFRIRTSVYQIPSASDQVILRVVGRGDPSFNEAQLQNLAQQIRNRGITRIDQLIIDDQYFQGDWVNPTWEWEDIQAGYGAPVNSLILNQNAINLDLMPQALRQPLGVAWEDPAAGSQWQIVNQSRTVAAEAEEFVQVGRDLNRPVLYVQGQLRVGSASEPVAVSIPQPTQHFLDRFQQVLAANQISVAQTAIATDSLSPIAEEIAWVESSNLADLIIETNQQSNNLYAESLLRQLGRLSNHSQPSLTAGINGLEATLTELGVDPQQYTLEDGSGLSRQNLVSPTALAQTLQGMARSPHIADYRASLSAAGINGTLQSRFRDTSVEGKFYGKTGALSGVVALSGYLQTPNETQLVISILVNQAELPLREVQAAIDAIVQLSAQPDQTHSFDQTINQTNQAESCQTLTTL